MPKDFNPFIDNNDDDEDTNILDDENSLSSDDLSYALDEGKQELSNTTQLITSKEDVASITNMLNLTIEHIQDDQECRQKQQYLCNSLDADIDLMTVKDKLEYLGKIIKMREFNLGCIFKAFNYIQRSDFAKELSVGSDRKERINKSIDKSRINQLLDEFNTYLIEDGDND